MRLSLDDRFYKFSAELNHSIIAKLIYDTFQISSQTAYQ